MKYKIITLGCKVNTYESNVIDDLLKNNGFIKTEDKADVVIINTCTVTNTANNKSLKMIRSAIKNNEGAITIVCGCTSQVYKEDVLKIDGVSIIIGNVGKSKIIDYINEYKKNKKQIIDVKNNDNLLFETMKLDNFDKTRAFVKIEDGCRNFCSYCIIPYTRGNVRSRDKESILTEIKELIKNGHKEIVLTGIHTGHYGSDLENYDFASLLNDLVKIEGLERLRISSIEITELNDRVLDVFKKSNILVSHLHIPLQSGSEKILKLMNRKYDKKYFEEKINKIRSIRPDISITTDVIVGFPGETEDDFNEMIDFITKINFSKLHVFPYSKREGTPASMMNNQIDDVTKKNRTHLLLNLSKKLEMNYMEEFVKKEVSFIPEVIDNEYVIGHTGNYLLIKAKGKESDLRKEKKVIIKEIDYPYCIGKDLNL